MNLEPLYQLIINNESLGAVKTQGVPSPYHVVWGGIKKEDRPKDLTTYTVQEVLNWQDSIDSRYQSEAAGAFQIMEDTLRGLGVDTNMQFNDEGQKVCCYKLLVRRGLMKFTSGEWNAERFGDSLAREWASLPVHSEQRGASRNVKRGQSYYAGDGLNHAHETPENVIKALKQVMEVTPQITPAQIDEELLAWLRAMPPSLKEML